MQCNLAVEASCDELKPLGVAGKSGCGHELYGATSPKDKGDSGEFGATLLIQTILYQAEVKGLQLVDTNS